jgi:WD40 repeat protein
LNWYPQIFVVMFEQFLLVATDKSRIIMFAASSGHQLRNFYGAVNDLYDDALFNFCQLKLLIRGHRYTQCRVAWSPNNAYVYCTSQDHTVCVWEVATQRLVHRLKGHTKTLRDIDVVPSSGALVSGSFDRSLRFWSNRS